MSRNALIGVILVAVFCSGPGFAQAQKERIRRQTTVMVIIPETHIQIPRIPDPACETAVYRALMDAGYKTVDVEFIKKIRYEDSVERIIRGGKNWRADLVRLRKANPADVLVTGEAFSELVSSRTVETDLGTVPRIYCRARVELKAIRMDTGERIWSDSNHQTGPPESTERLSSKACLEAAGQTLADGSLIAALDKTIPERYIELKVTGLSFSRGDSFRQALRGVPGVKSVAPGRFTGNQYEVEATVSTALYGNIASRLETAASMKKFRFKVRSVSGSLITADAK